MSETVQHQPAQASTLKWAAGGSLMEAFGALAVIALSIAGLTGIFSITLAAIATVVLGAAVLLEGGAFGLSEHGIQMARSEQSGGMSADFLAGITNIILGILALLGVASIPLISVALIVFGGSFLFSTASLAQVNPIASGGALMVGVAALVLGIVAICGVVPLTLVLVGLLVLGGYALLSGTSLGLKILGVSKH